ncbi:unnamed protein product [Blepharisma stoltei]|uniref:Uncharacterized protein n=1 Tax=Blepharisma stoltei TaxID=1481888 RepID=A0AAU9JY75_9CILI|nr:unnamed protein product [Blepharisma stoltei]
MRWKWRIIQIRYLYSLYRSSIWIFVYDVTKRETFENLNFWINKNRENGLDNYLSIVVGNKADLERDRTVLFEDGQNFSNDNKMMYLETSAKTPFI